MPGVVIEQAICDRRDKEDSRLQGRSAGFLEQWLPEAQRLCAGFGERPAGVVCPPCVFARPFARHHVAVVQAADRGADQAGGPVSLGFRLLVMRRGDYEDLGGDPFLVAERFAGPWPVGHDLPTLAWPLEASPGRTVADVQRVLQRPDGPALLGGVQALLDGGRLVFERSMPDTELLRSLWLLLPTSTRGRLWPASFAFGDALGFDVLVVPHAAGQAYRRYLTQDQAEQYPEGRYELNLQIAAEAGSQAELDALFARRSRTETWRLGLALMGFVLIGALVTGLLTQGPVPRGTPPPSAPTPRAPGDNRHLTGQRSS